MKNNLTFLTQRIFNLGRINSLQKYNSVILGFILGFLISLFSVETKIDNTIILECTDILNLIEDANAYTQ